MNRRRFVGRIISAASLVLLLLSIIRYTNDRNGRRPAERFLVDFDITARRPAEAATIALAPSADLAANQIADIAMEDALGSVTLTEMSPQMRERWLRAVERIDDELEAARDVSLDAAAARPGWSYHWSMLGRVLYAFQRRLEETTPNEQREWQETLATAMKYAPGDFTTTTLAASAYLEAWPFLDPSAQREGKNAIRRALLDASFAGNDLIGVLEVLGRDETVELLPDEPRTLRSAVDALAASGDLDAAAAVYRRWESSEWHMRAADLSEIERRARLNDVERLRSLTSEWLRIHHASDFDTPEGQRQVLRVLQLSINDHAGVWGNDPRAGAVSFLLDGRITPSRGAHQGIETSPGGAAIANAVSALTGVPEPVRARAHLLSGDIYDAEAIFQRSDSAGSFEWTPFLVDLAAYRLTLEMPEAAHAALEALAPAARNECNALLAGRELARMTAAKAREQEIAALLPSIDGPIAPSRWSPDGSLSLCVDPDLADSRQLTAIVEAKQPALVEIGWNGGRRGTMLFGAGRTALRVSLSGLSGRSRFFVRTIAGGPATAVETNVERVGQTF